MRNVTDKDDEEADQELEEDIELLRELIEHEWQWLVGYLGLN